jgi:hypothetical protein
MLLRAIQDNAPQRRKDFFLEIRGCRRRPALPVERTALAPALQLADEFAMLLLRYARCWVAGPNP